MRRARRRLTGGASALIGALLALALLVPGAAAQTAGTVRGHVFSGEGGGERLPSAVVEVAGAGRRLSAEADASGAYEITGVPAGRRVVRASHIGHETFEIEVVVPAGQVVRVDLNLPIAPVPVDPVRVDAGHLTSGIDTIPAPDAELGIAGARALRSGPGIAEIGLATVVQGRPGQEPPDPSDVLYVRGAAADLKLVFLDGAPVYAPFPLGGVADAFLPDVLQSATVFLGGAPARYDGGLSYVMDLRTRGVREDGPRTSGALDLLTGRVMVESPVAPGLAVLLAGRTVHGAAALQPLPYGYREGLVRVDAELGGGVRLHATGFTNDEDVRLGDGPSPDSAVTWGNTAGSLRLVAPLLGGELELTAAGGSYGATLPLRGTRPGVAEGTTTRERLAADLSRRHRDLVVRLGASADRLVNRYSAQLSDGSEAYARVEGGALGIYTDLSWQASERLAIRGGLRADHFSAGDELVLAPRLAVTFLATERASVTAAAGRYHQYLRAPDAVLLFPRSDSSAGSVPPLSLGSASHATVTLDQEVVDGVRLGVEGFFKSFEGIPTAARRDASASGVDVWLRRETGRWTGWAGYSLAWVWSVGSGPSADRFAGRHLLSAGGGARVARAARVDARFAYGSGLPYAAIPVAPEYAGEQGRTGGAHVDTETLSGRPDAAPLIPSPDRPYVRLDLSATYSMTRRMGGRTLHLDSYLKLLNTFGGRDALFYRYDRSQGEELTGLAVLPIVPVVGLEWRF